MEKHSTPPPSFKEQYDEFEKTLYFYGTLSIGALSFTSAKQNDLNNFLYISSKSEASAEEVNKCVQENSKSPDLATTCSIEFFPLGKVLIVAFAVVIMGIFGIERLTKGTWLDCCRGIARPLSPISDLDVLRSALKIVMPVFFITSFFFAFAFAHLNLGERSATYAVGVAMIFGFLLTLSYGFIHWRKTSRLKKESQIKKGISKNPLRLRAVAKRRFSPYHPRHIRQDHADGPSLGIEPRA
jgi:hypothetical protein